jgi:hypothetical protein
MPTAQLIREALQKFKCIKLTQNGESELFFYLLSLLTIQKTPRNEILHTLLSFNKFSEYILRGFTYISALRWYSF